MLSSHSNSLQTVLGRNGWDVTCVALHNERSERSRATTISIVIALMGAVFLLYASPVSASEGTFFPPHTDFGVDSDGNNRYEVLQLDVGVSVTIGGNFTIQGILNDTTGSQFITNSSTSFNASPGAYTANLTFNGSDIFQSRTDGPYNISLTLFNDTGVPKSNDTHMTAAYSYLDFAPVIAFAPPHTDRGIDTDANSRYNFLQVDVSVNTSLPGLYMVFGMLASSQVMDMKIRVFNLTAGDHVIQLNFSGIGAFVTGSSGNYSVILMAMDLIFGQAPVFQDTDTHITRSYLFTDFEDGILRYLTGQVIDEPASQGVFNEELWLANKTHRWLMQIQTNETGFFNFTAFEGDFVLSADTEELQSRTVAVTVAGDTNVNVNLTKAPADENRINLTFLDWGNVSLDFQGKMREDNQSQRFMIDQFVGDGNLYVDPPEQDLWLEIFRQVIPTMNDTTGMFEVDGIPFELVDGTFQFDADMLGDVTSSEPVVMTQTGNYTSKSPIPVSATHQVMMNVTYDSENETEMDTITFPIAWILDSYQAPVNVSVVGLNNNTVIIDALPRPSGEPEWAVVRLNATRDTTPPAITTATASPDPQEVPQDVTISAEVTDNSGISSVKVNVTDPTGSTIGNFTMQGGSTYTYTASYDKLGLHNFTVWAEDDAGLFDSFDGNFTMHDTTPPSLGDPEANPSPQEAGLAVDFTVGITDNHQLDEVKIAIDDPDGVLVGNFTMTLSAGNYTYSRIFTKLGTYNFTVWASDVAGNLKSKSGQFTMQDTTPPQITDVTASPDPQEIFGDVNITVSVTETFGITSVRVNITDPDGVTVGNFTMMSLGGGTYSYEAAYDELGTYSYTISAEDTSGNIGAVSGEFTIRDTISPEAATLEPFTVNAGESFTLDAGDSTDNHEIVNYTWNFGDGTTGYGVAPTHAYSEPGSYTVTLTVRDAAGNEGTHSFTVTVESTLFGLGTTDVIIYGIIAAVLVIAVVVGVLMWRRTR